MLGNPFVMFTEEMCCPGGLPLIGLASCTTVGPNYTTSSSCGSVRILKLASSIIVVTRQEHFIKSHVCDQGHQVKLCTNNNFWTVEMFCISFGKSSAVSKISLSPILITKVKKSMVLYNVHGQLANSEI